ncbi:voltage-dependent calcium channel type D subunit alpha-1-like [Tropilaelaps mercedesae]|uniref:Voltage-dependent calcium channel type D subunit alpha-1-like n=1 Tax=Tropilaelaps mercedesae TaxID=418985 RepID=A0A1V9X0M7_9ACAR|nr:voltage-dependent calcium channel type D subunit alpha-1-like [Tropilaelaps mercedesae]
MRRRSRGGSFRLGCLAKQDSTDQEQLSISDCMLNRSSSSDQSHLTTASNSPQLSSVHRVGVSDPLGTAPAAALAAAGLTSLEQLGAVLQEQTRRLEQQQQQQQQQQQLAPNKFLPAHRASYHGQRPHVQNTLDPYAAPTGAHLLTGSAENLVGRVLHEQVRTSATSTTATRDARPPALASAFTERRRGSLVVLASSFAPPASFRSAIPRTYTHLSPRGSTRRPASLVGGRMSTL